jgi:hypothetical protein
MLRVIKILGLDIKNTLLKTAELNNNPLRIIVILTSNM